MSLGEYGGQRLANRKKYRMMLSTTSENDHMKDRRCSKTSLDCLPLTLWNSPFSKSDDRSTNVRINCENFFITRQDNKSTSAPLPPSSRAGGCCHPLPLCSGIPDYWYDSIVFIGVFIKLELKYPFQIHRAHSNFIQPYSNMFPIVMKVRKLMENNSNECKINFLNLSLKFGQPIRNDQQIAIR